MAEAAPKASKVSGSEECNGCRKPFKRLLTHLASSSSCRALYDFEKEKEERRKKTFISSQRKKREGRTEEEKKIEDEKKKNYMQQQREALTEEEKEAIREKDRIAHKKRYDQLKNDPIFKETLRQKQDRYRQKIFGNENRTRRGRKRLFNEHVRYGLIFPCCTCQDIFHDTKVVEIGGIEEFKEKLNGAFPGLFEEAVAKDIDDVPKCRTPYKQFNGKYYICTLCKKYLFQGKMPPKSNMNNLKSPDLEKMPELQLSELETSLLARNLVFMKIYNLPKSRMSALKDRTICVPIDHETMMKTLQSLPRPEHQKKPFLCQSN